MFCSKCGSELNDKDLFCGNCGLKRDQKKNHTEVLRSKTETIKEETNNTQKTWKLFFIIVAVVLFLQSKSIYDTLSYYGDFMGAFGQIIGGIFLAVVITIILNKVIFRKKNNK